MKINIIECFIVSSEECLALCIIDTRPLTNPGDCFTIDTSSCWEERSLLSLIDYIYDYICGWDANAFPPDSKKTHVAFVPQDVLVFYSF